MCEYCAETNTEDYISGGDGIVYNEKEQVFNIYVEHFRNEKHWIPVKYCPQCGKRLRGGGNITVGVNKRGDLLEN